MAMISLSTGAARQAACHGGCGLCLCLDEEQVAALGLHRQPPAAGASVDIRAIATVRRMTQDLDAGEAQEAGEATGGVTLELHVTDLEVTPEAARQNGGRRG